MSVLDRPTIGAFVAQEVRDAARLRVAERNGWHAPRSWYGERINAACRLAIVRIGRLGANPTVVLTELRRRLDVLAVMRTTERGRQ